MGMQQIMIRTLIVTTGLILCLSSVPVLGCYASNDLSDAAASGISVEDYKDVISELKDELREGNLNSEEDIRNAIHEAENKYGVDISDSEEQKAVDIMNTANDLGIESDKLADVVDDVYDNIADKTFETASEALDEIEKQVIESAKDAVVDSVKKSLGDYLKDLWEQIKEFFRELVASWIG